VKSVIGGEGREKGGAARIVEGAHHVDQELVSGRTTCVEPGVVAVELEGDVGIGLGSSDLVGAERVRRTGVSLCEIGNEK
jgi:hypothetical protein